MLSTRVLSGLLLEFGFSWQPPRGPGRWSSGGRQSMCSLVEAVLAERRAQLALVVQLTEFNAPAQPAEAQRPAAVQELVDEVAVVEADMGDEEHEDLVMPLSTRSRQVSRQFDGAVSNSARRIVPSRSVESEASAGAASSGEEAVGPWRMQVDAVAGSFSQANVSQPSLESEALSARNVASADDLSSAFHASSSTAFLSRLRRTESVLRAQGSRAYQMAPSTSQSLSR